MPVSARVTDLWAGQCCCHSKPRCRSMGGFIVTGSPDAISAGQGQAGIGSITIGWCGHTGIIITGSPDTFANNNKGKDTVGSQITGCNRGTVIIGNPTHMVN